MNDSFGTVLAGIGLVVGVIVVAAGVGLLMAFPIMWCWNYVIPYLFALPTLTWGKAWCLGFLANVLVRSTLTTTKK